MALFGLRATGREAQLQRHRETDLSRLPVDEEQDDTDVETATFALG